MHIVAATGPRPAAGRYGTQLACSNDGHRVPRALAEDETLLDGYRKSAGLPPFAEYLEGFGGECGS
jgi:hypothetical protein